MFCSFGIFLSMAFKTKSLQIIHRVIFNYSISSFSIDMIYCDWHSPLFYMLIIFHSTFFTFISISIQNILIISSKSIFIISIILIPILVFIVPFLLIVLFHYRWAIFAIYLSISSYIITKWTIRYIFHLSWYDCNSSLSASYIICYFFISTSR